MACIGDQIERHCEKDELVRNAALISSKGRIIVTEKQYCQYRTEFSTCIKKDGAQEFSAIVFDEDAGKTNEEGYSRVNLMAGIGVLCGICIEDMSPVSSTTADSLENRCARCYVAGFRFATQVTQLNIGTQSKNEMHTAVKKLTEFAKVCQQNKLVPVLEIKTVGSYNMETIESRTQTFLAACFESFLNNGVHIEAIMLKPNMARPTISPDSVSPDTVANRTIDSLLRIVPSKVPALIFPEGDREELVKCAELSVKQLPWKLVTVSTFREFLTATGNRYI